MEATRNMKKKGMQRGVVKRQNERESSMREARTGGLWKRRSRRKRGSKRQWRKMRSPSGKEK